MRNKKQFLGVLISVLVCVFIMSLVVYATTTVGDDVTVGADLVVTSGARIGTGTDAGHLTALADDSLFIEGEMEINGTSYFDGSITATEKVTVFYDNSGVDVTDMSSNYLSIYNTDTTNMNFAGIIFSSNFDLGGGNEGGIVGAGIAAQFLDHASMTSAPTDLIFWTGDATLSGMMGTSAERMRITSDGLVGINTTTPSTELSIVGTVSISQDLWASGSFQFGGGEGTTAASYSRLGSTGTGHSLADADDLMVSGNMEVDGTAYFDGLVSVSESNGIMIGGGATIFGGTASPQGATLNCTAGSIYIHAGAASVDETIAVCETTNSWQWADL